MTNSELPIPVRPFQRRRLRNVRQDRSRVNPFKDVRASQAFQVPHNWKRTLAPFDDTPEPRRLDTHHHYCPLRRVRFLDLCRQFQPRVSLPHQRPQMAITPRDALHKRSTRRWALRPSQPIRRLRPPSPWEPSATAARPGPLMRCSGGCWAAISVVETGQ